MVIFNLPDTQTLEVYTDQQVADMASPERVLVIIYDLVYDLTEFLDVHPGGSEIIYEMVSFQKYYNKQNWTICF